MHVAAYTMSHQSRKTPVLLYGIRLLKSFLSFFILYISSIFFGVDIERDIWILSSSALIIINQLFWGAVTETFRTRFIHIREQEGERIAILKAGDLLGFINVVTITVVIIILLFPEVISRVLAPNMVGSQLQQLNLFLRILSFSLIITQINNILTAILNAYNVYFIPEYINIISLVLNIVLMYMLVDTWGIYSLILGYYVSGILLFFALIYYINVKGINIRLGLTFRLSYTYPFLLFALPYYLPYFFGQISQLLEKTIASLLPTGSVSMLDYARRLVETPLAILTSVMSTLLIPVLSRHFINNETNSYNVEFKRIFQLGMIFFSFFIPFLQLFSLDIVFLIYGGAKGITTEQLYTINDLIVLFGINGWAVFLYQILIYALMASGQVRYLAFWGILPQIISIVINYLFYREYGLNVFPVSSLFAHFLTAIIYYLRYPFRNQVLLLQLVKYSAMVIVIIVSILLIKNKILLEFDNWLTAFIIKCSFITFVNVLFFYIFNIEEKVLLFNMVRNWFAKK